MDKTTKVAEVPSEIYANQVKLFGKWNCDEVGVEDISLQVSFHLSLRKITYVMFH